jgi:hypothetical protein
MVINSWIIMNSRLRGDDSYSSTSHGKFRLFHFKSEIAKFLLTKLNIQIFPTAAISLSITVYQSAEENEPPTKKLRETRSSVTDVVRYDNSDHWPLFISAFNNTRCIRMKTVLEKHIGNAPNVKSSYALIQAKIVLLNIIFLNKFLLWTSMFVIKNMYLNFVFFLLKSY